MATACKDVGETDRYALLLEFKMGASCYMKDRVPDDPTYVKCPE